MPGFNAKTVSLAHGGAHTAGRRKLRRPIDPQQALHLVLRSSCARGSLSMLHPKHCNAIEKFTHRLAKQWGVRVYRYSNIGNHLHLLIKVPSRAVWQRFLRELAGTIAIMVTGARNGAALAKNASGRGFWDQLAFTRIVKFGRDFENVGRYVIKNLFEAAGVPVKQLLAKGFRILHISQDGRITLGSKLQ